jgi:hypothetical protein
MTARTEIELRCRRCCCRFAAPAQASEEEILDRMTHEGPWFALAPGATFRDMIATALERRGKLRCPDCGRRLQILRRQRRHFPLHA